MIHPKALNEIKKQVEETARKAAGEAMKVPTKFVKAQSSHITLTPLQPSGYTVGVNVTLFVPGAVIDEDAPASDA